MDSFSVTLDPSAAVFYQKVAERAGLPIEQVLSDALYRLAGSLSLEAMARSREKPQ